MNILFLTTFLPGRKQSGGEIASQAFIDAIRQAGHTITVLGYQKKGEPYQPASYEVTVDERYMFTKESKLFPIAWMALSFVRHLPYSSAKYYSKAYVERVTTLMQRQHYDAVVIDHSQIGWIAEFLDRSVPLFMVAHNIEHELYLESATESKNPLLQQLYRREARLIQELENGVAQSAKRVWTLTHYDAAYFSGLKAGVAKVFDIPGTVAEIPAAAEKTYDVGLIGSWMWKANLEGLEWFFQSVYPLLPQDISIRVAGKGADWLRHQYPNVEYCGFVDSVEEFMAQARVIAIPSTAGGGIQIKTLDSIASGSQIVATPFALRGISQCPSSVSIAEQPAEFAAALLHAIQQPARMETRMEAIAWSRNRTANFLADVATELGGRVMDQSDRDYCEVA